MNPKRQPTFLLFARTLFKFASRADRDPSFGSRSVIREPKKGANCFAICKNPVQIRIKSRSRSKFWIAIRDPSSFWIAIQFSARDPILDRNSRIAIANSKKVGCPFGFTCDSQ
jgi:hypothetical protein